MRDCDYGGVTRACAEGWRGRFDVTLDRNLAWPVLTVQFYAGSALCGYAAAVQQEIVGGDVATFAPERIAVSDEFGTFRSQCALPVTITRMEAVLWSDADWGTEIRQELAATYTFVPSPAE